MTRDRLKRLIAKHPNADIQAMFGGERVTIRGGVLKDKYVEINGLCETTCTGNSRFSITRGHSVVRVPYEDIDSVCVLGAYVKVLYRKIG